MPGKSVDRKITKGRVVRTPEGFEVGQSVHFVPISPRTWIMTLEPVAEAQRLAAAIPTAPASSWEAAMARVRGIPHAAGRRPHRKAGPVEPDNATSDEEAAAFATIATPKRRARSGRAVVR
jgi:hypothetical protein